MKDKKDSKSNNVTTAFSLPLEIMEKIRSDAKRKDRTPSYVIRQIVVKHYAKHI